MAILDKKLLLEDIKKKLNAYVPANTVTRIINDAAEVMVNYEITRNGGPDGGGDHESLQLLEMFLDAKTVEGKAASTINKYRYNMTRLLKSTNVPFKQMTVYHLRQHMMKERDRGICMNTIRGNTWDYNSFFGWLFNEGLIESNPVRNIGHINVNVEEEMPFTDDQIQILKENCDNIRDLAIIHFFLSTGCRVSEVCSVNRNDIDYANLKLKVKGKGSKFRTVYIDKVTAMMLKRYLETRDDIDPALFYNRQKKRITPEGTRRMLNAVGKRANIPCVHPHRFRHTLATNLIDRGMSIQEVSMILGHADIRTTMKYIHINEKNAENSYRKYACM